MTRQEGELLESYPPPILLLKCSWHGISPLRLGRITREQKRSLQAGIKCELLTVIDTVATRGHNVAMSSKRRRKAEYPATEVLRTRIREDAALYGLRRDVLGVREAKDQLSAVLQRAADGEEIVITSDGKPLAMIVAYKPVIRGKPFEPNWAYLQSMKMTPDSTPGIRAERDSGP